MGVKNDLIRVFEHLERKTKISKKIIVIGLFLMYGLGIYLFFGSLKSWWPNLILPLGILGFIMMILPLVLISLISSLHGAIEEKSSSYLVRTMEFRIEFVLIVLCVFILLPAIIIFIFNLLNIVVNGNISFKQFLRHFYDYSFRPIVNFYTNLVLH